MSVTLLRGHLLPGALLLALGAIPVLAVSLPHTFTAGETARASEVNANFQALQAELIALRDELEALAGTLAQAEEVEALRQRVDDLEGQPLALLATDHAQRLADLSVYLRVYHAVTPFDTDTPGPLVRFEAANVQVVNGSDDLVKNGLGNLIVGYNTNRLPGAVAECSVGGHGNENDCVTAGGVWAVDHKTGSHNVVIGGANNYPGNGNLVAGYQTTAKGNYSLAAGFYNTAVGNGAAVVAGSWNTAHATAAVLGGSTNTASGPFSAVAGGSGNSASANNSVVLGGAANSADSLNDIAP